MDIQKKYLSISLPSNFRENSCAAASFLLQPLLAFVKRSNSSEVAPWRPQMGGFFSDF